LDTGANSTNWRPDGLVLIDPSIVAKAIERISHVGGAGGVVEVKQRELATVEFRLGPVPVVLRDVAVQTDDPVSAARVGMDAVAQFGTFILDFEQMRIDGRLKTPKERATSGWKPLGSEDIKLEPDDKK
jgi:hypothetical protein